MMPPFFSLSSLRFELAVSFFPSGKGEGVGGRPLAAPPPSPSRSPSPFPPPRFAPLCCVVVVCSAGRGRGRFLRCARFASQQPARGSPFYAPAPARQAPAAVVVCVCPLSVLRWRVGSIRSVGFRSVSACVPCGPQAGTERVKLR